MHFWLPPSSCLAVVSCTWAGCVHHGGCRPSPFWRRSAVGVPFSCGRWLAEADGEHANAFLSPDTRWSLKLQLCTPCRCKRVPVDRQQRCCPHAISVQKSMGQLPVACCQHRINCSSSGCKKLKGSGRKGSPYIGSSDTCLSHLEDSAQVAETSSRGLPVMTEDLM